MKKKDTTAINSKHAITKQKRKKKVIDTCIPPEKHQHARYLD
jgi:hypothetical protein